MNRAWIKAYLFRAISLYLLFAVGNTLFWFFSPQLMTGHGRPEPSGFVWMLGVLGIMAVCLGFPANFLPAAFFEPLNEKWAALWLIALAPVLNALLYAWLIPLLFRLAELAWRGIMQLPKEPE